MAFTKVEVTWDIKRKIYIVETFHKNGEWEGSSRGAKIYPVSNVFVYTEWGNGIPIAVFQNIEDIKKQLSIKYPSGIPG